MGGGDAGLEVLGEPSIAVQPSQCALDHPAARYDIETARTSRALDNLQGPPTDPLQSRRELGAGIGTVGEDVTQPGEGVADGREHRGGAVAILDVGGVDLSGNQQACGVGEDVAFAALDLLARVKAPWTAAFRGLDRLAVDDAGRWAGLAPLGLAGRPSGDGD